MKKHLIILFFWIPLAAFAAIIFLWLSGLKDSALIIAVTLLSFLWTTGLMTRISYRYGIRLRWSRKIQARLVRLARITENFNLADMFSRALALYDHCIVAQMEGKSLMIDDKELEVK